MKTSILAGTRRLFFLGLLAATSLLATSCEDDTEVAATQDYTAIDEAIIVKYLADNNITNAQKQPSGLYYVPVLTDATATRAVAGKNVSVLYTGQLMNGTVFDASSLNGNTPISFVLGTGRVIPGWDEGIALMHKGDKGVLLIPSRLGYGARGAGSSIPPNAVLRFQVELTDVR